MKLKNDQQLRQQMGQHGFESVQQQTITNVRLSQFLIRMLTRQWRLCPLVPLRMNHRTSNSSLL
jgi:hypothetical protein